MEVTIFTNFNVSETDWYNIIDESYDITTLQSSEPKWTIELPRKELKKLKPLIVGSNLAPNIVPDNSITIYAVLEKIPKIRFYSTNIPLTKKVSAGMIDLTQKAVHRTCSSEDLDCGIRYGGGVDINIVNCIQSRLKNKFNIEISTENYWESVNDTDCHVYIPVPESFNVLSEINQKFAVYSDSEDVLQEISDNGIQGIEIGDTKLMTHSVWEEYQPFELVIPLGSESEDKVQSFIQSITSYLTETLNVDDQKHELRVTENSKLEQIKLYLPIQQYRDKLLPSNVGEGNDNYMIQIQCDDEEELERFSTYFSNLGYLVENTIVTTESVIQYHSRRGKLLGNTLQHFDEYLTEFVGKNDKTMIENGYLHTKALRLIVPTNTKNSSKKVDGIGRISINYCDKGTEDKCKRKLSMIGYKTLEIDDDDWGNDKLSISFGGLNIHQVLLLESKIKTIFGIPKDENAIFKKNWPNSDLDITVYVPDIYEISTGTIEDDSITQWLEMESAKSARPYIHIEPGESVRIGETVLNMYENSQNNRSPPNYDQFTLYCVDQATANTLNIVASNVSSCEPCLLEGETATSKTSIIQFLAHLIQQPVTRINLNGQTDTGELIGRYVPNDSEDSRVQWVWENGEIIKAMKYGWWVILDEVNLAEPQILERLNSLLEKTPTLKATETSPAIEFGGSSGELVHPSFRIFATMNPAEYSGRIALSPAYKDRWTGYSYVPLASEIDILHMLNMWVFGETPPVNVDGVQYDGKMVKIPLPNLNELSKSLDVKDLIVRISRSHYTLSKLASTDNSKGISMSRKERPVFSRRLLTRFMTFLDENIRPEADVKELSRVVRLGLVRYYIRRVHSEEDLSIISETLDGQGIGPNVWNLWTE